MARGIHTLWYKRHLLNPFRHGWFAFALLSHKLCRWLVYLLLPTAVVGMVLLSTQSRTAAVILAVGLAAGVLGLVGMRWPTGRRVPPLFALPGFVLASNVAGMLAWLKVLRGQNTPMWEPTRRS
jgi:hypothetical protein